MENGPIFEWIPGNTVLDGQEYGGDFYNLINDLHEILDFGSIFRTFKK